MIKKIIVFLFTNFIVLSIFSQKTVTGVIISGEDNLPLAGVTVVIEGTTQGTITDFDGKYSIKVASDSAILVFSYLGFETVKFSVKNIQQSFILKPLNLDIEEVVITVPYGSQKKESFTGSVGLLQAKQIDQLPVSSFEKTLQGNVSGVISSNASGQPGSGTQIRIRGIGSISAGSEPLYVLDGIPINSQELSRYAQLGSETSTAEASNVNILSGINPNDIESITILKDAAATSLYGSRASNGVIMITTKQGKSGKTKYSFRTMQGISSMTNSNLEMLNTDEYLEIRNEALENAGYSSTDISRILGTDTVSTNWFDEVYDYGYYNTYELSASGGSEKTTFFLSGLVQNDNGIVLNTGLNKYIGRLNVTHNASEKLNFGAKVNISYTDQDVTSGNNQLSDPIVGAYILPPNMQVTNPDGTYNFSHNGSSSMYNVIGISNLDIHNNITNRMISNVFLEYKITDKITFKSINNYDWVDLVEYTYISPLTPDGAIRNGRAAQFNTKSSILSTSNTLNYNRKFKEKHSINFILGYEIQKTKTPYLDVYVSDFPNSKLKEPGVATTVDELDSYIDSSGLISYISNLQYNFKDRYYLSGSFRRDGSSKFSPDHKWGNFWSIGGSWRISEENFLKSNKKINSLKLRGSVGTSGNSDFPDYKFYPLYGYGYDYNGKPGGAPEQLGNSTLTWEKNLNYDIGLDFRVLKRISGSVEYYSRKTYDLLLFKPYSATTGSTGEYVNAGEMLNRGIEITLNTENISKTNFSWTTDISFALNKNKITKLFDGEGDTILSGTKIRVEGEALQTFYLADWAGVDPADGSAMWYDENGELTKDYSKANKVICGTADPLFTAGLTNSLTYKNISLSFLFYLNYGNLIYNAINQDLVNDGSNLNFNQTTEILDRWQEPGDVTDVPKVEWNNSSGSNETSTRYLEDGSYLRLKNLTLSYQLGSNFLKRTKLRMAKIFLQGQNLWTWTNYSGLDPEQNIKGLSRFNYPNVRTITLGLDINF